MPKFAVWYDGGVGWYDYSHSVDVATADEAVSDASLKGRGVLWSHSIVVTRPGENPNDDKNHILAERWDPVRTMWVPQT